MFFKKLIKGTKEKAEKAIEETKEQLTTLSTNANDFLNDSNNAVKTLVYIVAAVGSVMVVSNVVSIATSIHIAKSIKDPKIVNNIIVKK